MKKTYALTSLMILLVPTLCLAESPAAVSNNKFAFDLYRQYRNKSGNIFFSPYSISSALSMVFEGAKGQTAQEIQKVFSLNASNNARRAAFSKDMADINKKNDNYKLSVANALWAEKSYEFKASYFAQAEKTYGGKVTNLDFIGNSEKSRLTVNAWVKKQTNDRIKDILPKGSVDSNTRLVLTNAIYFFSDWASKFNKKFTYPENFYTGTTGKIKADMMHKTSHFNYTETKTAQIIELPYKGEQLSMIIILPKDRTAANAEKYMTAQNFQLWQNNFSYKKINLSLPKFKFETKYSMAKDLAKMGMPTAFTSRADFTGMSETRNLFISDVIHQTFVEVNETSTEAAAATAVNIVMTSAAPIQEPTIDFKVDHPFIFAIQHNASGEILFMGKVNNPK